jgi:hypothetical protein
MLLPKSIAKILGGVEVLGKPVRSELELAEAVRHGFLPAVTDELFDGTVLSKSDMERLVMPRCMLTYRIKKGRAVNTGRIGSCCTCRPHSRNGRGDIRQS